MKTNFTDTFCKNIQTPGRYSDPATKGLNLNVKGNSKYWILRYLFAGKRHDLTIGIYPEVTLKEARNRAIACRAELIAGRRPNSYWKLIKSEEATHALTFRVFSKECIDSKAAEWRNNKHTEQW